MDVSDLFEKPWKPGPVALLFCMLLVVPMALWQGYVVSKIWNWCISPAFDVQQLGIASAIGLVVFCSAIRIKLPSDKFLFKDAADFWGRRVTLPVARHRERGNHERSPTTTTREASGTREAGA